MTTNIQRSLAKIDWPRVAEGMHARGYAHVPGVLTAEDCRQLIATYDEPQRYRKTITMERYRFGLGEYKYFTYPLPEILQTIRETVYPHLTVSDEKPAQASPTRKARPKSKSRPAG